MKFYISCAKNLENLLVKEIEYIGARADQCKLAFGGIWLEANLELMYQVCLRSRLANRVILVLENGKVRDREDLYGLVQKVEWFKHLGFDKSFKVNWQGKSEALNHSRFAAQVVKDALHDYYVKQSLPRPEVNLTEPDLMIQATLRKGYCTLGIDLSGASLHQRGYRETQGPAPIKENLAAAVLYRSGWGPSSDTCMSFVDPMMGSGTLVLEAAMIASEYPAQMKKEKFGFHGWAGHQEEVWDRIRKSAFARHRKIRQEKSEKLWVRGYDAHPGAVAQARRNAQTMGLEDMVKFHQGEVRDLEVLPGNGHVGIFACNPPYGERLGAETDLMQTYAELGDFMRLHPGWVMGVISSNDDLLKATKVSSRKRYQMMNGPIPCTLAIYELDQSALALKPSAMKARYHPDSLFARVQEPLSDQTNMFVNRIKKNQRRLKSWLKKSEVQCYRLYDRDLPEFNVAVDIYQDWIVIQEYKAPATIPFDVTFSRLQQVIQGLMHHLALPQDQIVVKVREKQKANDQYRKRMSRREYIEVEEGKARFLLNLWDYLDTGLFLDHRPIRRWIYEHAHGKSLLNLFSYTGSVSVQAGVGGAEKTVSVDTSNTYLHWAEENLAMNGLKAPMHTCVRQDVMQFLAREKCQYDLIFIDPPSFSNSKSRETNWDVQRDHRKLVDQAAACLKVGGIMIFSTNLRSFKLDPEVYQNYEVQDYHQASIDPDFHRNSNIHYCWLIKGKS